MYFAVKDSRCFPEGQSDLNVRYTLPAGRSVTRKAYPGGRAGWGARLVRVPHTGGTLVIGVRDSSTKSLVWRAIAREEKSNASQMEAKLDDMARKAIEKYPPKVPKEK